MPQCAVVNCNNTHRKTKGGSVRYHRFPGDADTRARWVQACGRHVQNCATARICSRHFSEQSYERDVQHELLGLPTRCRLKKGAVPDTNLPPDIFSEDEETHNHNSAIAVLLAVGLVPTAQPVERTNGGLPQDLNKMHVMEDVHEGCNAQPSSPGHADQRQDIMEICNESDSCTKENEDLQAETDNELKVTEIKKENNEESKIVVKIENIDNNSPINDALPNIENETNNANDDSISSDSMGDNTLKRKLDNESSSDLPSKRLHAQIQKCFQIRDEILCKYMESIGCNTLEQIQSNTEHIMSEIRKLNEIAKQKEKEWNNVLHLKKMKEELLIRLQRQKQLILLNNDDFESECAFTNEDRYQNMNNDNLQQRQKNSTNVEMKSPNYLPDRHTLSTRQKSYNGKNMVYNHYDMNGQNDYRQSKNRPTLNVKSLIADYRQKHPETIPRRGRRIRTALSQCETKISAGGVLNLSNMALGSGAQVRQNPSGMDVGKELGLLTCNNNELRKDNLISTESSSHTDSTSFKDMLAQFAKLSQAERQEILHHAVKPPPPYPEVTVHPVPTTSSSNSLLHGILTKNQTKPESKSTFSPTLARLLTAPEKNSLQTSANHGNGVASITDILCNSKGRNEITITPVVGQYDIPVKGKTNQMEEDETEDSVDRLVIDESGEVVDARSKDNGSDIGDEVPQCQGCNQKPAQFVCAGCANQWYCSRDCQVSAWDEHSEVCSG